MLVRSPLPVSSLVADEEIDDRQPLAPHGIDAAHPDSRAIR